MVGLVLSGMLLFGAAPVIAADADQYLNLGQKKLEITRGMTEAAVACVECHAKKTPGIVEGWKLGKMGHAAVSCYDCHVVDKSSPMASQCEGLKGTRTYLSPMVSSSACARCHPGEVEQFLKSGHATLASKAVIDNDAMVKLQLHYEGGGFIGIGPEESMNRASREAGCQMCHGGEVELGLDNKPINGTWPAGIGHRYPDGGVGNCTVCHTRHTFSVAEARKPEACASCHLGPDHPNIEIYHESKHGQVYLAHGEEWEWDSAPDAWEPGDYTAPTCATCHMSGIGELATTHNINERLEYDLVHKISVVRSGERGDGEKGKELMKKVCINCHGATHVDGQRQMLDNTVDLYNTYWGKIVVMEEDLKAKNLLKVDPWKDPFQELAYYFWHHAGRRARHGTAMNGPDYTHWHGFFQLFQIYKDLEDLYDMRIKTGKIEELSPVMSTGPL
jgi:hypothetical protein